MSQRQEILTPVGRLVQGSLYQGQTTDLENRPLVYKDGTKAGQPRTDYFFAIAIPKGSETHWRETQWGSIIWQKGQSDFPKGQANHPSFAWKIIDGDSSIPNKAGRIPCQREGFARHWVLNFSSSFAPSIYNADGTKQLLEPNAVNLGDWIQVFGSVVGNDAEQQPGVYLNHSMVAFAGYGERIIIGPDAKSVGFGNQPLPTGCSPIPLAQGFNPATPVISAPPVPHTAILNPVARIMTPKANGATYEQMIKNGWNDELLIQHGMMQA